MKSELIKQISKSDLKESVDPKVIQEEIKSLQNELQLLSADMNQVDVQRRSLVIKRINQLFPQLIKAQKFETYKKNLMESKEILKEKVGNEQYIKRSLETASLMDTMEAELNSFDEKYQAQLPMTQEEFKDYLMQKGWIEAKADKTTRRYFTENIVVQKIHAIEATTDVPEIEHENQLHLEHYRKGDPVIFPMPNSITPRPNLLSYDAADYYEIPQIYDPATQGNRAYDLVGLSDKLNPVKKEYPIVRPKNVMGRRKPRRTRTQNPPLQYKRGFSTVNSCFYMSQLQYLKYSGAIKE